MSNVPSVQDFKAEALVNAVALVKMHGLPWWKMRNNNNAAHFMNPPLERYKNAELQQATEVQKLAYQEFINEGFLEFVDGEVPYCRVSAGGLNLICTKLGLR